VAVDVGVHDTHRQALLRQRGRQVDRDRRLADAALAEATAYTRVSEPGWAKG
jgi:hypothetical protein